MAKSDAEEWAAEEVAREGPSKPVEDGPDWHGWGCGGPN